MIIQLIGNVTYPITLDPTVWIFDDRKILFEEAFHSKQSNETNENDDVKQVSERFEREYFIKPPVNQSINRFERNKILENTYVMPISDFIKTAEIKDNASQVKLETTEKDVVISIDQLKSSLLLFAKDGKPLKKEGPVHLYFKDGSNKDNPIKSVKKINIE